MDLVGDSKNFISVTNSIYKLREEIHSHRRKPHRYEEDIPEELLRLTTRKDGRERHPILKGE